MISIGLIEDNRLVREGLTALLRTDPELQVVASASGDEATMLPGVKPQVVLLDIGLPHGHSLRLAKQIKQNWPDSQVIVMDVLPVYEDLVEFVNVGVSGFVMKDATFEDLITTVRSVAQGAHVLPPQMATTLFARIATEAVARGRPEALDAVRMTPREREVINLIAEGLSNKEIATRLEIATDTVKSHVRNVMEKLMLHTRLQIAAFAHRESKG